MESLKRFIFLALMCVCLGVGNVVGQDDVDAEGELNSAAEAPIKIRSGKPLSLTCNLTNIAEEDAKVEWIKDGEKENILKSDDKYTVFEKNYTLLIKKAMPDDAGTYECSTTSKTPFTKQFSVYFFYMRAMPKSLVVVEAEDIKMTCEVRGKPIPTVQWLKDDQKLNDSDTKYEYNENDDSIPKAVLSFKNSQQVDRGMYTCQVSSDMGVYNSSTYIRVKSIYAPLYPAVGILIEIVLLAVVIIFFERRAAKQEYEESDTDQGADMKNASETQDSAARQRK